MGECLDKFRSFVRGWPWRELEKPTLAMLWLAGGAISANAILVYVRIGRFGADAQAYWETGEPGALYSEAPGTVGAFLYSPAFAQAISPLTLMSWPPFFGLWLACEVLAFIWLFRPLGWRWVGPLTLLCASELVVGNTVPFLAILAILGLRHAGWWALVFLTKPTMALGPVWFLARLQWRQVAISLVVTLSLVVASFTLAPEDWFAWARFLAENAAAQSSQRGLAPRLTAAVVVTIVAARLGQHWMMAIALLLATPVASGAASLTILAAIPRLLLDIDGGSGRDARGPTRARDSESSVRKA